MRDALSVFRVFTSSSAHGAGSESSLSKLDHGVFLQLHTAIDQPWRSDVRHAHFLSCIHADLTQLFVARIGPIGAGPLILIMNVYVSPLPFVLVMFSICFSL